MKYALLENNSLGKTGRISMYFDNKEELIEKLFKDYNLSHADYDELKEKGEECDLDTIAQDIKDRDERDMNRAAAPLKQAEDAILVDSSYMTIPEVVSEICSHCK